MTTNPAACQQCANSAGPFRGGRRILAALFAAKCVAVQPTPLPSNTSFGWLFTIVFLLLAGWAGWIGALPWAAGFAAVAVLFLLLTLLSPELLRPLNRAWMALGYLLGRIISPIVLGVMFFGLITPFALVMRLAGRDALKLRAFRATTLQSHWVRRDPVGPAPESFRRQY